MGRKLIILRRKECNTLDFDFNSVMSRNVYPKHHYLGDFIVDKTFVINYSDEEHTKNEFLPCFNPAEASLLYCIINDLCPVIVTEI